MVSLKLKDYTLFKDNPRMGLFYAIADVYSNKNRPINDTEMVEILNREYCLKVERRTIKRYREFIGKYFDIDLTYEKKGYYVKKDEKPYDDIIEAAKFLIKANQDALEAEDDWAECLNVTYKGVKKHLYPIEILMVNDEPHLLCLDGDYYSINIRILKFKDMELNIPYDVTCNFSLLPYYDYLYKYEEVSLEQLTATIDVDPYDIDATLILKKDAPIKKIKEKILKKFKYVKTGRRVVDKQRYYAISFTGKYYEVTAFVLNNRKYLVKLDSEAVKDELRVMFNLDIQI